MRFLCLQNLSTENCNEHFWINSTDMDQGANGDAELTFSNTALRRRSTLTILDKSPTFDSNSRKRFHTSTESCGVSPPEERTRSNSTRVLLSSVKKKNEFWKLLTHFLLLDSSSEITIQMRQVVNVAHDIIGTATEFLQPQFEYTKRNILIFAAVVFHERSGNKDMVPGTNIFSGFFEHGSSWFYAFGAPRKFHVLNICLAKGSRRKSITFSEIK